MVNRLDAVELLVGARADVNAVLRPPKSFHKSKPNGNIRCGGRADLSDRDGRRSKSCAIVASALADVKPLCRLLATVELDVGWADEAGESVLHHAARDGRVDVVRALFGWGPVTGYAKQAQAARRAAEGGWLRKGALPPLWWLLSTTERFDGGSPLSIAISSGHTSVVQELLDARAPIGQRDYDGLSPLAHAHLLADRQVSKVIDKCLAVYGALPSVAMHEISIFNGFRVLAGIW